MIFQDISANNTIHFILENNSQHVPLISNLDFAHKDLKQQRKGGRKACSIPGDIYMWYCYPGEDRECLRAPLFHRRTNLSKRQKRASMASSSLNI
ncbi:Tyrosine--tRNA ligase, cytoplasmic [Fusarium oxysporum f. sp. albedinis]|nr:Tyrosine--tRNA ligase, cytoplasmic [Fusarium oxysporum f. sp. albedinis]